MLQIISCGTVLPVVLSKDDDALTRSRGHHVFSNPPPQLPIAVEAITLLPNLLPQFLIAVEAIALFPSPLPQLP